MPLSRFIVFLMTPWNFGSDRRRLDEDVRELRPGLAGRGEFRLDQAAGGLVVDQAGELGAHRVADLFVNRLEELVAVLLDELLAAPRPQAAQPPQCHRASQLSHIWKVAKISWQPHFSNQSGMVLC
jgi:hypothetical protein